MSERRTPTTRVAIKNVGVILIALLLASLGGYNIVLKATWTLLDDGVFWKDNPAGVVAARVAAGGPAAVEGLRVGDVLVALDGDEILTAEQVRQYLTSRHAGSRVRYSLLRADERRAVDVTI